MTIPSDALSVALSLIVPTWKTGHFAPALCQRAANTADRLSIVIEIVFVVDDCPAGSGQAVRRAACAAPVRVVELAHNVGQDAAIREGLRVCRGQFALILDGDLQDPPEALALLWPHRREHEAVFADRRGPYESAWRKMTSRAYRWAMQVAGGLPNGAGLFVLVNRRIIDEVAGTRRKRISVLAAIAAAGGRFTSVPVVRDLRNSGSSGYTGGMRWRKAAHSLVQTICAGYLGVKL